MGYNPFQWWKRGKKKKRLPQNAHLFDKIQNGDFDYSYYFTEAEEARREYSSIFQRVMKETGNDYAQARHEARMKNVRALKLDEEAEKDEFRILKELRDSLHEKFGFDLWDKMMEEDPMTLEELYDYYCEEKMRRNGLDF